MQIKPAPFVFAPESSEVRAPLSPAPAQIDPRSVSAAANDTSPTLRHRCLDTLALSMEQGAAGC
ncbi:MAG TPA: hypothetical protein VN720_02890 [Rudaea sp.]|nr:hypothetical protein [Rudaea sp.]